MITKLLTFFDVARLDTPRGGHVRACSRARAAGSSSPASAIRCVPRSHRPLECRWHVDPRTGTLAAVWFDPSAKMGTKTSAGSENIPPRRCFRHLAKLRAATPPAAILPRGERLDGRRIRRTTALVAPLSVAPARARDRQDLDVCLARLSHRRRRPHPFPDRGAYGRLS